MLHFIFLRMKRTSLYIGIVLGIIISLTHIFTRVIPFVNSNDRMFTPFTMWLGIDSFSFLNLLFYLLIPLISSLAFSDTLKKDIDNGFIYQVKVRTESKKYFSGVFIAAFLGGTLMISIPLLLNQIITLLLLPSYLPDELINRNIALISTSTLFVDLYYSHPYLHLMFYTFLASLWGGLFACFTLAISLWLKNNMIVIFSAFLLQLVLYLINTLVITQMSITPFDFLPETILFRSVTLPIVSIASIAIAIVSIAFYWIGVKRNVWL